MAWTSKNDPWGNYRSSVPAVEQPPTFWNQGVDSGDKIVDVARELQSMMAGLAMGGASRHVSAAVASAIRTVASLKGKSNANSGAEASGDSVREEVHERLAAIEPALRAQVETAHPQHSSHGLVPPDIHVRANGAKHQFAHDRPFHDVTASDVRKTQRGDRMASRHDGCGHLNALHTPIATKWAVLVDRAVRVADVSRLRSAAKEKMDYLAEATFDSLDLNSAEWEPFRPVLGNVCRTTSDLMTNDDEFPIKVIQNTLCVVQEVDDEGDIAVSISGKKGKHWIIAESFGSLEGMQGAPG